MKGNYEPRFVSRFVFRFRLIFLWPNAVRLTDSAQASDMPRVEIVNTDLPHYPLFDPISQRDIPMFLRRVLIALDLGQRQPRISFGLPCVEAGSY